MADVVESSADPATLIPTGPLTNIANFLKEHPHLKDNVERIVLMGGSVGLGNATPPQSSTFTWIPRPHE